MSETMDIAAFEQSVREAAYYLWENEGRPFGRHVEHWLISEEGLRGELSAVAEAAVVASPEAVAEAPKAPLPAAAAPEAYIAAPEAAPATAKKPAAKKAAAKTAAPRKKKPTLTAKLGGSSPVISETLQ